MYEEADDCLEESTGNYVGDSDAYNTGLSGSYEAASDDPKEASVANSDIPEFLKQERAMQAALEAAKRKQEFMTYKVRGKFCFFFTEKLVALNLCCGPFSPFFPFLSFFFLFFFFFFFFLSHHSFRRIILSLGKCVSDLLNQSGAGIRDFKA